MQIKTTGHQTEYIQNNRKSIHWQQTTRTDRRTTLQCYWLIIDQLKFIIDTGSPVTLIPKSKSKKVTALRPITVDFRDVNNNKTKFEGRTTEDIELDGPKNQLELLITTKNTNPFFCLDWMGKLGITLESEKFNPNINHINKTGNAADHDITTLKRHIA